MGTGNDTLGCVDIAKVLIIAREYALVYNLQNMRTLKEIAESVRQEKHTSGYYIGYKTAIEGILEDIQNASVTSVETIEKYLQDLLK